MSENPIDILERLAKEDGRAPLDPAMMARLRAHLEELVPEPWTRERVEEVLGPCFPRVGGDVEFQPGRLLCIVSWKDLDVGVSDGSGLAGDLTLNQLQALVWVLEHKEEFKA